MVRLMNFNQEKIPATFSQLLEICSYQQELLTKYEEYIEQNITSKILEEDYDNPWDPMGQANFKRITIPQSTFMLRCDPSTLKAWKLLQYERPVFEEDYFIKTAFIEEGENKG